MYYIDETFIVLKANLSDDQRGTPKERYNLERLVDRFTNTIESKSLGWWSDILIEDGVFYSKFFVYDRNLGAKLLEIEVGNSNLTKGSVTIDSVKETLDVDHINI